jgi:hypothetical protein
MVKKVKPMTGLERQEYFYKLGKNVVKNRAPLSPPSSFKGDDYWYYNLGFREASAGIK